MIKYTKSEYKEYSSEFYEEIFLYKEDNPKTEIFKITLSESYDIVKDFNKIPDLFTTVNMAEVNNGLCSFKFGLQTFTFKVTIFDKNNPRGVRIS